MNLGGYMGLGFIGLVLVLVGAYHWPWFTSSKRSTQHVVLDVPQSPVDAFEAEYGYLLDIEELCAEKPTEHVIWAMQTPEDRRAPYLSRGVPTMRQFWKYAAEQDFE